MSATKNTATESAFTVDALRAWVATGRPLVRAMQKAQQFARSERARVDAYVQPTLARFAFSTEDGQPVTRTEDLYLCDETAAERIAEFDAECEAAHRAHGFHGPAGYCPALIAENDACKAEAAVLESLGTAFEFNGNGGNAKTRESLLALAVQMTA